MRTSIVSLIVVLAFVVPVQGSPLDDVEAATEDVRQVAFAQVVAALEVVRHAIDECPTGPITECPDEVEEVQRVVSEMLVWVACALEAEAQGRHDYEEYRCVPPIGNGGSVCVGFIPVEGPLNPIPSPQDIEYAGGSLRIDGTGRPFRFWLPSMYYEFQQHVVGGYYVLDFSSNANCGV